MNDRFPSLSVAVARMRRGDWSPVALVEACLARIEKLEGEVQAWTYVAADEARRQAAELAAVPPAQRRGLLWGAPIAVKDIVDVAGMPCEAGSPLLRGRVAAEDAPLVVRLRAEGAIILGKTVTTQFACFDPSRTHNPWDLDCSPGGSSSGSAAAIACGMCLGAIGSQTGGSIIRPASYCGVAGFKPTHGAIDLSGVIAVSPSLDHAGPLAQDATGLMVLFGALTGQPASDQPLPEDSPCELVLLEDYFDDEVSLDVRRHFDDAVENLPITGSIVSPRPLADVIAWHRTIMAAECALVHRERYAASPEQFAPHVGALVQEGGLVSAVDYLAARAGQREYQAELNALLGDRIALTPSTDVTAPDMSTTGNPRFQSPTSFAGVPAVTIPFDLAVGMPCGLQLIGAQGTDAQVLETARWCEDELGFEAEPPWVRRNAPWTGLPDC
ncbi:amidase [Lignipirellula cremea]|uniref:Glutamyl-tRNA(Gln) amidotransferase subunit A n=1 Tax=Lignipirellula cremea TaxID=2528010 RepID=A0A518E2A7_9BACT|nr:amidase [Lignipirellula cremea]QDU98227.1 Glutamyl-tRNA(Gln) amidotransferase subunit A [Lignipirellula cremea]